MKKNRFKRTYNVSDFLNRQTTRQSFVALTVTGHFLSAVAALLVLMLMLTLIPQIFSAQHFKEALVSNALPFFYTEQKNRDSIGGEKILLMWVSSLLDIREQNQDSIGDFENIDSPPVPKEKLYNSNVEIKNETQYQVDANAIIESGLNLLYDNPKVLIVHTHGSESYTPSQRYSYEQTGNYRTSNTSFNMIRIGEEIAGALREKGIEVIHDKTINDYPSYNDSYNKTEKVIKSHISKDSDIKFVFDIHRDAVGENQKFAINLDGKDVANVMVVCGTDTNLDNPDWRENLKLAVHIQNYFNERIPHFLRPINLRKERFNMHLTAGSLLFEVGASGNTLDEALLSAKILGEGLGDMISAMKK